MTFSDLGYQKAQLEIQQQEENSPLSVQSEVKPFTTKAPVHVIEALDTVAEEFGMSRNAFVLKLWNFIWVWLMSIIKMVMVFHSMKTVIPFQYLN